MTKKERLDECLATLKRAGGIDASAIVTREGLLVTSDIFKGTDPEVFAAMSATMVGAAESTLMELTKGTLHRVIVQTPEGQLIATGAGPSAVLVALTHNDATLGTLLVEMTRTAVRIQEIL